MGYTHHIKEVLKMYDGVLYKMIEIKIIISNGKFTHKALPIGLLITDGTFSAYSFINRLSGNQKELFSYFTVDAFTGFSNSATIQLGYGGNYDTNIENIDVQNISPLPSLFNTVTFQVADNAWLQSL